MGTVLAFLAKLFVKTFVIQSKLYLFTLKIRIGKLRFTSENQRKSFSFWAECFRVILWSINGTNPRRRRVLRQKGVCGEEKLWGNQREQKENCWERFHSGIWEMKGAVGRGNLLVDTCLDKAFFVILGVVWIIINLWLIIQGGSSQLR